MGVANSCGAVVQEVLLATMSQGSCLIAEAV